MILSPFQEQERNNLKKTQSEEKVKKFLDELKKLQTKYRVQVVACLNMTIAGIRPELKVADLEATKDLNENKP